MSSTTRRDFLRTFAAATGAGVGTTFFPPAIRKALAIGPRRCKGSIEDVERVGKPLQGSDVAPATGASLPAASPSKIGVSSMKSDAPKVPEPGRGSVLQRPTGERDGRAKQTARVASTHERRWSDERMSACAAA